MCGEKEDSERVLYFRTITLVQVTRCHQTRDIS